MFIDLHTHTLFSDGVLLPSELVYRAKNAGYKVIAITDHIDCSNYDFIIPRIVKVSRILTRTVTMTVIPGVEITYVPPKVIPTFVKMLRKTAIKLIVVHGETPAEPVPKGTNYAALVAKVDILAHPGNISVSDVMLAKKNNVYLELTTRKGHRVANPHVYSISCKNGMENNLIINTDTHQPQDLLNDSKIKELFNEINFCGKYDMFLRNSQKLISQILKR